MGDKTNRILIVDDNKDIHEDIRYILDSTVSSSEFMETLSLKDELFGEGSGSLQPGNIFDIRYRIDDAYQGEEAIKMVKRALEEGEPYSLIFMDVRMPPGIDGIKAIEEIWKVQPLVEVVICTAYSDYSWDQILAKLGQNDHLLFIKKPFDSVSVKQLALSMTTKWNLQRQVRAQITNLEEEVGRRTQELRVLVEKLTHEIGLRQENEKLLVYNAHHDSLTDLLNRRSFYLSLTEIMYDTQRKSRPFSLFFIDIDDFKNVNDVLGHDIGDRLLIEVSDRLKAVLGEYTCDLKEIYGGGFSKAIFRLGGDEFTAIVSEGGRETVEDIADRLLSTVRKPYHILKNEILISCSVGISIYPQDSTSPDELLKCADLALYEAKKTNDIYTICDCADDSPLVMDSKLESDLRLALERKQIELHYQCLVDTKGRMIGVQALARWNHPEFGLLQPERFIHIAEKSDRIVSIGKYILKTALEDLKEMHGAGFSSLFVLVNCTTRQFYHTDFVSMVKDALSETGVDAGHLKLGLEEKFSLQATDKSIAVINELDGIGVKFTLNGFENEHPAFVFLQQMPRDTIIKLNRDYVRDIAGNAKNRSFLLSLMDIIKSWDLDIIVSGVETSEQKSILDKKDCILQGYHFNFPKPLGEFLDDMKRSS